MAETLIRLSPRQIRIQRAEELLGRSPAAAGMLAFYLEIARFQAGLYELLESNPELAGGDLLEEALQEGAYHPPIFERFGEFLSVAEKAGPQQLAEHARGFSAQRNTAWNELLDDFWEGGPSEDSASGLLARAFLQPYAEYVRSRSKRDWTGYAQAACPFCGRKAGVGVLRPVGDGGKRSLVCSFCQAEWDFRRIVCVGCGEENENRLAVYTAQEFPEVRVECCDSCKQYIKTVDLTKNGLADPVVDEIAAAALDLWAQERGYAKWQVNLVGM